MTIIPLCPEGAWGCAAILTGADICTGADIRTGAGIGTGAAGTGGAGAGTALTAIEPIPAHV